MVPQVASAKSHRYRERLLRLRPLDRLPLEKAIHWNDATAPRVGFAKHC
jgi:hypothetical protein